MKEYKKMARACEPEFDGRGLEKAGARRQGQWASSQGPGARAMTGGARGLGHGVTEPGTRRKQRPRGNGPGASKGQ